MKIISAPSKWMLTLLSGLIVLLAISCQKELSDEPVQPPVVQPIDLSTKVTSSVSGFVTNENDEPVQSATVSVGNQTTVTDEYGYFELKNVQVVKNAATVTVSNPNYFAGIRTYIAEANKSAFVRIKLIPKTIAGSFAASAGGSVTLLNGLKVSLPASAVVNALTGAAYSGNVNVAAAWLNPTAADLDRIMPGDLRGLDASDNFKQLVTYGMAAVELTGSGGEKLQVAPGKKAGLAFPLPATLTASAPATIPLWYFDETIGLWKEQGNAVKTGNTYEAQVSHFSFWNCDVPANFVQVNMTIKDHNGNPVPYTRVRISRVNGPESWASGYTDSSGYASGAIPANAQLKLEVFSDQTCSTPVHIQTFASSTSNISLGVITVNTTLGLATITGTATTCTNTPVTNGFVILKKGNLYYRHPISPSGAFSFTSILCNNIAGSLQLLVEDVTAGQQSNPSTHSIVVGNNAVGNLQACGVTTQQFFNLTIGGVSYIYTPPTDSLTLSSSQDTNNILFFGASRMNAPYQYTNFSFSSQGIAVGSTQPLHKFSTQLVNDSLLTVDTVTVNITEFGTIGQFVSGNFTGTVRGGPPANTVYPVSASFRIRRYF